MPGAEAHVKVGRVFKNVLAAMLVGFVLLVMPLVCYPEQRTWPFRIRVVDEQHSQGCLTRESPLRAEWGNGLVLRRESRRSPDLFLELHHPAAPEFDSGSS